MARKKYGSLRDTKGVIDASEDQSPEFAVPGAEIIELEEEKWSSIILGWVKGIILFIFGVTAVLAALLTILGATLMIFSPIGDTKGVLDRTLVVREAWASTGGKPPMETSVAISHTKLAPANWWEWVTITWVGIPDVSEVKIMSTDYEKLYIQATKIVPEEGTVVDETDEVLYEATVQPLTQKETEIKGNLVNTPAFNYVKEIPEEEPSTYEFNHTLNNQYLVECVQGECEPGDYMIISSEQIFGEVR